MPVKRVKGNGSKAFEQILKDIQGLESRVGWFEGNTYPDKKNTPVAYVAAIQEHGSIVQNIPPRPFLIPTAEDRGPDWGKTIKASLNNNFKMRDAFEALSLVAVGDIKAAIVAVDSPALAPSTVRARIAKYATKGGTQSPDKPLIDSGQMISTLTYQIDETV